MDFLSSQPLGWNDRLQALSEAYSGEGQIGFARISSQNHGTYRILLPNGERQAVLARRFPPDELPAIGDWAAWRESGDGTALITGCLERKNALSRLDPRQGPFRQTIAANVDVAMIVMAFGPDWSPNRAERYLSACASCGIEPVVVLSKADTSPDPEGEAALLGLRLGTARIIVTSSKTGNGIADVGRLLMPGTVSCLVGSSGSGKSTLVNTLAGREILKTREVREYDGRGRHTSTERRLVRLENGALIIDNPGMREISVFENPGEHGSESAFEDMEELARRCRFSDCGHENEPGCKVREALELGTIDESRFNNWRTLREETTLTKKEISAKRRQQGKEFGKLRKQFSKDRKKGLF